MSTEKSAISLMREMRYEGYGLVTAGPTLQKKSYDPIEYTS
jgi:hypothetical protein